MQSKRKFLKEVLGYMGNNSNLALQFMIHRTVYSLGALQGMKEELGSFLCSAASQASFVNAVHKEALGVLENVSAVVAKSLAILRTMVVQLSSMDIEFLEQHPWLSSNDEQKKATTAEWTRLWRKTVLSLGEMKDGAMKPRTEDEWVKAEDNEVARVSKKSMKSLSQEVAQEIERFYVENLVKDDEVFFDLKGNTADASRQAVAEKWPRIGAEASWLG